MGTVQSITAENRTSAMAVMSKKTTCNPIPTKPTALRDITPLIYLA